MIAPARIKRMSVPRLPRLYLRPDLVRSIPTPEQALSAANRKGEQFAAKQQREIQADATRRQNAAVRADDHARMEADRRFAAKQRADAAHLEGLRRAIEGDDEDEDRASASTLGE